MAFITIYAWLRGTVNILSLIENDRARSDRGHQVHFVIELTSSCFLIELEEVLEVKKLSTTIPR